VLGGYKRLAERILEHGGVPCMVVDYHSLMASCRMTLPQTLRALAAAPPGARSAALERTRGLLLNQVIEMRMYRYVRPDAKRFYTELVPLRPKGTRHKGVTFKQFKTDYLRDHPLGVEDRLPKQGWLRFGFPHSYNPDLLEAMLAFAELGVPHQPALDEALDHIEAKRGQDGRWKLDSSLNGKMLADVETGSPSTPSPCSSISGGSDRAGMNRRFLDRPGSSGYSLPRLPIGAARGTGIER
jgi:hypothetical protein